MKLTKRERFLIYLALIIGFFAIYYQYYLTPKILEMQKLSSEIADKKRLLNEINSLNSKSLEEKLGNLDNQLKELNLRIPDNKDIEIFLFNLENMIYTTGVKVKTLSFEDLNQQQPQQSQQLKEKEEFVTIPINISVSGKYNQILSFIEEIQKSKRLCNIQAFDIVRGQNPEELFLNMQISIYSMKDSGSSKMETTFSKGKSDPFKPLFEMSNNMQQSSSKEVPQNLQGIDLNKIISDTIEKFLKESKTPSSP
ncbi:Tfp pilus assembly protein PilO [Thermoanaerobacter kivui]|uniref:Tfp pilus assembly protein PilO n=1 Tax=Thermoanaerobacter kivui TaxID=2325 RepID=A0A097ARC0_THEKI|nr:type 4a pilus biogenesis protein PilO [Thermoanaerobacter kivui]AIS52359.1 Tfp pilus assembly protein PilO [Thermoanaerobacter kivui]